MCEEDAALLQKKTHSRNVKKCQDHGYCYLFSLNKHKIVIFAQILKIRYRFEACNVQNTSTLVM